MIHQAQLNICLLSTQRLNNAISNNSQYLLKTKPMHQPGNKVMQREFSQPVKIEVLPKIHHEGMCCRTSIPGLSGYFSKWSSNRHFENYPEKPWDKVLCCPKWPQFGLRANLVWNTIKIRVIEHADFVSIYWQRSAKSA